MSTMHDVVLTCLLWSSQVLTRHIRRANICYTLEFPLSIWSLFIYPTMNIDHCNIRERYSTNIDLWLFDRIRSKNIDLIDNRQFLAMVSSSMVHDYADEFEIRLRTDINHYLGAAYVLLYDEQERIRHFSKLRASIMNYMNNHQSKVTINIDDLLGSFLEQYLLPFVFSQLPHICMCINTTLLSSLEFFWEYCLR
jgi:hypothetical protein